MSAHSSDDESDGGPQFHEIPDGAATEPEAVGAEAAPVAHVPQPAVAVAEAPASIEQDETPVLRLHGVDPVYSAEPAAESSGAPVLPSDAGSQASQEPTPSQPPPAQAAQPQTEPAAQMNGSSVLASASGAQVHPVPASSSSSSSAAAAATPPNAHAAALAAALLPLVQRVHPDAAKSGPHTLDSILALLSSLPYDARTAFFAHATTVASSAAAASSSSSSTASASASSNLWVAMLNYFIDSTNAASSSGTAQDPVCRFLYDSYWQASTKLGHEPVAVAVASKAGNDGAGSAAPSVALPPAHLFLLNFLPFLLASFLSKFYASTTATGAAGAAGAAASTYAGLFTVFLAVYNTERILCARGGGNGRSNSILHPAALPDTPEVRALLQGIGADGTAATAKPFEFLVAGGGSAPVAPSIQASSVPLTLPALSEPTGPSVSLLLHVLLRKLTGALSSTQPVLLLPETREAVVYFAGWVTDSGLLVAGSDGRADADVFAAVLGPHGRRVPVRWNTRWSSSASGAAARGGAVRFGLSKEVLQDLVVALTLAMRQGQGQGSGSGAAPSYSGSIGSGAGAPCSWRDFVLVALRQVHCRALEEMLPEIMLQTTCLLQEEENASQPPAGLQPVSPPV